MKKKEKYLYVALVVSLGIMFLLTKLIHKEDTTPSNDFETLVEEWYDDTNTSPNTFNVKNLSDTDYDVSYVTNSVNDKLQIFIYLTIKSENKLLDKMQIAFASKLEIKNKIQINEDLIAFDIIPTKDFDCKKLDEQKEGNCEKEVELINNIIGIWTYNLTTKDFERISTFEFTP